MNISVETSVAPHRAGLAPLPPEENVGGTPPPPIGTPAPPRSICVRVGMQTLARLTALVE